MEQWKAIPAWEGYYEVSDLGQVKSLERIVERGNGRSYRLKEKMLRPSLSRDGYWQVVLFPGRQSRKVHRLVLEAFVGPRADGMECRHLNSLPTDNRPENLEWGTRSENQLDAVRRGTQRHQKLDAEQVLNIRQRYAEGGISQAELGRKFGVARRTVRHVINRTTWKHI